MSFLSIDLQFMQRALRLAEKGAYTTHPNPRVGCVIVKDNVVIAEGFHEKSGSAHAEVNALKRTTQSPEGATAYVTLEPCNHHGLTPPCTDALIKAGIKRVVIAMCDPHALVNGRGVTHLKAHGVEVIVGVLEEEAKRLNRGFISRVTRKRPFVRAKAAMSLDGRIALENGESQWITGKESRAYVQHLRAQSDAIITGVNTVLADDPRLTVRTLANVKPPLRVVLDSHLRISPTATLFTTAEKVIIATVSDETDKIARLEQAGAEVWSFNGKRVPLLACLEMLSDKEQVNECLIETGSELLGALIDAQLVDELMFFTAPILMGEKAKGVCHLASVTSLKDVKHLVVDKHIAVGNDWLTIARLEES